MNTGAFGENFPYSNFHDLNMDWIIKIAKDFLDQYTHIQEVIANGEESLQNLTADGLTQLQTKADTLEALLQQWYDTHSEDIANQLADALADMDQHLASTITAFNQSAEAKAQQTIASIPSDYTTLANTVTNLSNDFTTKGLMYAGDLRTAEDDLDNIKLGTVYSVTSASVQHNPAGGSCIVVTYPNYTQITNGNYTYATQIVYGYADVGYRQYVRYLQNGTWGTWERVDPMFAKVVHTITSADNVNDLLTGTLSRYDTSSIPANAPTSRYSCIILTLPVINAESYAMQIAMVLDIPGLNFYRFKNNNQWTIWYKQSIDTVIWDKKIEASDSCNNVRMNTICTVYENVNPANWAFGTHAGLLFTFEYVEKNDGYLVQFAYDSQSNLIATRLRADTWNDWNYLDGKKHDNGLWMFGDSITWGYTSESDGHSAGAKSPYNYPAMTAKLTGMVLHNMSALGQGLMKDWRTIKTTIANTNMSDAKLITIGWAYNDEELMSGINFGQYTDMPTGEPTTYIGYYQKVMRLVQEKCPNAQVMLVTGYGWPDWKGSPLRATCEKQWTYSRQFLDGTHTYKEIYDELEKMCELNGWTCVNQANGTVINRYNCTTIINDNIHPTWDGYKIYSNYLSAKIASYFGNIC